MPAPSVLISILNWNGGDKTLECLRSVFELDYQAYSVVVWDNGSIDGSPRRIANCFPQATLVESATNLGFCGGHNAVITDGLRKGFDYFWVLNNDSIVSPQSLSQLVECMEGDRQIGLASPIIYFRDQPERIQFCGAWLNLARQDYTKATSLDQVHREEGSAPQRMVLYGTALVLRRDVAEQVGVFNERYFAYYEDIELSFRSARAGFINKVVGDACVWHEQPATGHKPAHFFYYMTRNAYWFWWAASRTVDRLALLRRHLARSLRRAADCRDHALHDCRRACILGFLDALAARAGPWNPNRRPGMVLDSMFGWHPYLTSSVLDGNVDAIVAEVVRRLRS
jgi:GT2 family glycosyltransferase